MGRCNAPRNMADYIKRLSSPSHNSLNLPNGVVINAGCPQQVPTSNRKGDPACGHFDSVRPRIRPTIRQDVLAIQVGGLHAAQEGADGTKFFGCAKPAGGNLPDLGGTHGFK